jgi:hypothetical protein
MINPTNVRHSCISILIQEYHVSYLLACPLIHAPIIGYGAMMYQYASCSGKRFRSNADLYLQHRIVQYRVAS